MIFLWIPFFTTTEKPLKFQKFAKPRKKVKARKEAEESSALPLVKQPSTQVKKEEDPMQKYDTPARVCETIQEFKGWKMGCTAQQSP